MHNPLANHVSGSVLTCFEDLVAQREARSLVGVV